MKRKEHCQIISHKEIARNIFEMKLNGRMVKEIHTPGQFVHVKVNNGQDPLLRRPISICSYDGEKQQFTLIYRKEGRGTTMLSAKEPDMMLDVLGPLGNGFPLEEARQGDTALLVGGGIGVPPLYELSRQLKAKGVKVIHVLGFQNKDAIFYEHEFSQTGEVLVATVDGSYGEKGFVTEVIENNQLSFDVLYACGPVAMLKALEGHYPDKKVFLSLEERMGCGIGACFACVCKKAGDASGTAYKKVCSDGPVFRAGEVVL